MKCKNTFMEGIEMLYFRFNVDAYETVTYEGEKSAEVTLGDFEDCVFEKLHNEVGIDGIGMTSALYDIIGIPINAFSVDDENIKNCDSALKYILTEFERLPIEKLSNRSLRDLGIRIELCKKISNSEVQQMIKGYMEQNNLSYIKEDVLWKNLSREQKIEKFSRFFLEISSEGKELIIVDPYLLKDGRDEYCDMVSSVINNAKAESVIIMTENRNCTIQSCDKIRERVNCRIEIRYTDDFHDRFWISGRKKGFYTGTSFNGIGNKISLINLLSENDVAEIVEELHQYSLI